MKTRDIRHTDTVRSESGFTLLEVLVALSIFMIGLLAIGSMQTRALLSNAGSRGTTEAVNIAMQVAEELMTVPWDPSDRDLRLDPDATTAEHAANQLRAVATEHMTYTVEWTPQFDLDATNYPGQTALTIEIEVTWTEAGRNRSVTYNLIRAEEA